MALAQSALEALDTPALAPTPAFGAIVARQVSVWPFAARTQRLFLLVDPSLPDRGLRAGLLRAMQQAYFRSDGCSQTRAVREAALAAHYVLRHRNRDLLPHAQVSAATAVAAVRGSVAYVALAGDAAAFAWRSGDLTGQRGALRLPRPLGLEQDPGVTLWSTPVEPGDRLVLVCGAAWGPRSAAVVQDVLESATSGADAEQRLADLLGGSRPAGVLVADPCRAARADRHLVLVSAVQRGGAAALAEPARPAAQPASLPRRVRHVTRLATLLAMLVLAAGAVMALNPNGDQSRLSPIHQSEALLAQAAETTDAAEAHTLAATALDVARRAMGTQAAEAADLVERANATLAEIDRVAWVNPTMAVRLGPAGANVIDLAVDEHALYTLDVMEASVRTFSADAHDQQPTPDTLVLRAGAAIAGSSRRLATPVAMRYVASQSPADGALLLVDQARSVVRLEADHSLRTLPLSGSAGWRELGALGGASAHLFVLDSAARSLWDYPLAPLPAVGRAPRLVLDASMAPMLAFERAAEIVAQPDRVFVRMDEGTLHRIDTGGGDSEVIVRTPDGRAPRLAGMAADGAGGLYLADPINARVLHVTADGALLRQFRDPMLAGLRQIQASPDGRRLFGLVASGVLAFDIPELPTVATGIMNA